jgi:hypothetical protein
VEVIKTVSKIRRYMAASWTAVGLKPATLVGIRQAAGEYRIRLQIRDQVPRHASLPLDGAP